jgi:hypothetical protein
MFSQELIFKGISTLLISVLLYLGYGYIKHTGFVEGYGIAEQKYSKIITDYNNDVDKKITNIETLANTLASVNKHNNDKLSSDISIILSKVKGKTLTIVKNGECVPNQTFSDSFGEINKRVNQTIKENQK